MPKREASSSVDVPKVKRVKIEDDEWCSAINKALSLDSPTPGMVREYILNLQRLISESDPALEAAKQRTSDLVNGLTQKEKFINSLEAYIKEFGESTAVQAEDIRATNMDSFLCERFERLQQNVAKRGEELKQAEANLKNTPFSANRVPGLRLVTKCRQLRKENAEFTTQLENGKIHKLECELGLLAQASQYLFAQVSEATDFEEALLTDVDNLKSSRAALQLTVDRLRRQHQREERERSDWTTQRQGWASQRKEWQLLKDKWTAGKSTNEKDIKHDARVRLVSDSPDTSDAASADKPLE
jgi:chromosome segregation ATPase